MRAIVRTALVPLVTAVVALGVAAPASAVVAPLAVQGFVPVDARGEMWGVDVARPSARWVAIESTAWSAGPEIRAVVSAPSADMVLGEQGWDVTDLGDGTRTKVGVKVVRASRLAVGPVVRCPDGSVRVTVGLSHYDPPSGRWTAAPASPVWVQRFVAGRWVQVAALVTDRAGSVAGGVKGLPAGAQVRIVRPEGARDAAVASGVVTVG